MGSNRNGSKLGPAPGGGTFWHRPGRKRPVAQTTQATSFLMSVLVADGASTFGSLRAAINYDRDAIAVCDIFIALGLGENTLTPIDDHGFQIENRVVQ